MFYELILIALVIEIITPPKVKPFRCPYCNRGYSSKVNVQLHLLNKKYLHCYNMNNERELSRAKTISCEEEMKEIDEIKEPKAKKRRNDKVSATLFEAFKMKTERRNDGISCF